MKTKYSFLILFILLFYFSAASQDTKGQYKIIKILSGKIFDKKTGKEIKKGDKISSIDNLRFSGPEDKALAYLYPKGQCYLIAKRGNGSNSNEWLVAFKDVISFDNIPLNTRGSNKTFPYNNYLVIDNDKILIDSTDFPMTNDRFFFVRYWYKEKEADKILKTIKDTLIFDRNFIFNIENDKIDPNDCDEFILYYMNNKDKKPVFIPNFKLFWADGDNLKSEILILLSSLKETRKKDYIPEIIKFLKNAYCNFDNTEKINGWIRLNIGINE